MTEVTNSSPITAITQTTRVLMADSIANTATHSPNTTQSQDLNLTYKV